MARMNLMCIVLALVATTTLVSSVSSLASSPCAPNASWNTANSQCECNPGFVGDGVFTCGAAHTSSVQLSPSGITSAIIPLPVPAGASNIRLQAVISSDANSAPTIFQTDGSSKGAVITPSTSTPPLVSNAKAQLFFEFSSQATNAHIEIRFTFSIGGNSVSEALILETFEPCSALDDLSVTKYGFTKSPELADVRLSWLQSTFQLNIEVDAPYERDTAIVMIDTEDFDSFDGDVRVRPQGSCSQRPSIPSSVPFTALFQSAPTATSPNALSGEFLAYPDSTATGWAVESIDCATVKYHRAFTLTDLTSCNQVHVSTATDPQTQAAMIKYAGSIFVNTLQPADDVSMDESAGYAKFTQQFPFELQIATEFEATVEASTDETRIHVVVRYLRLEGSDMVMMVETQIEGHGLKEPRVISPASSNALITADLAASDAAPCLSNGDTDICIQRWVYRQPNWSEQYNARYDFVWRLFDSTTDDVTVPISLKLRINNVNVIVGKLGDLALRLYSESADAQTGSTNIKGITYPWHVTERIFMRGDVMTNPADVGLFTAKYRELWVCFSPVEGYDISLANGGCLDPLLDETNRAHLVSNGAIQTTMQAAGFRTSVLSVENGGSSVASGISFDAFPLTGQPHVYTIHARVLLENTNTGKKREVVALFRRDANSPSSTARMMLLPSNADASDNNDDNSESSSWMRMAIIGGAAGGSAIGIAALVAAVVISRKNRQTHQPVMVDLGV